MNKVIIMPGGFHPFHAGHMALYNSAVKNFPDAEVYVAATDDTSQRPFPFAIKEKLAKLAGVPTDRFVKVKSPFRAEEITSKFDPKTTQLIFVRSNKDRDQPPKAGTVKKDGTPSYLQPYTKDAKFPFEKHAYMAYLPTVEFAAGMTSATEIRRIWPVLETKKKIALVMSLYPRTQGNLKLAENVVALLDAAIMPSLTEAKKSAADSNSKDRARRDRDLELKQTRSFIRSHYPAYLNDPETGFEKWVQRALAHSESNDRKHQKTLSQLMQRVEQLEMALKDLQNQFRP
jgi:hypothetical protein